MFTPPEFLIFEATEERTPRQRWVSDFQGPEFGAAQMVTLGCRTDELAALVSSQAAVSKSTVADAVFRALFVPDSAAIASGLVSSGERPDARVARLRATADGIVESLTPQPDEAWSPSSGALWAQELEWGVFRIGFVEDIMVSVASTVASSVKPVDVRAVLEWDEYGIDLSKPHSLNELGDNRGANVPVDEELRLLTG